MAYIYGTGKTASKLYYGLSERGIKVKGFLQKPEFMRGGIRIT